MKIALLSDLHGNAIALDAVLADLASSGPDEYWILGDLVALGPDPVGVLQRLDVLPNCRFIRGNTDRYTVTGDRPPPFPVTPGMDPGSLAACLELAGMFAWTLGAVTSAGWFDWLSRLPLEYTATLPDGTSCLCVHASPGRDDGPGFHSMDPDEECLSRLQGCAASLLCVGHTHQPFDRVVGNYRVVNPGSLSNSHGPDLRASYALLEAMPQGVRVEHRRVEYDRQRVVDQVRSVNHPGAGFITRHMTPSR